jgi:hypothetical protein|tara:strand:- start:104 stop:388 length:285 start_codon:yes stop_codon:yes gene_type:complete
MKGNDMTQKELFKTNHTDLGIMNGWNWDNPPAEYTQHLAECGTERIALIYHGDPKNPTEEIVRDYNESYTNLGTCYNQITCNDCGITYRVDSSG